MDDPVLRRWLLRKLTGRARGPRTSVRAHPPYLGAARSSAAVQPGRSSIRDADAGALPSSNLRLDLAGYGLDVDPSAPGSAFDTDFPDHESFLFLHRFSWLALDRDVHPTWAAHMWRAWMDRHGEPDDGWPWHPYTAAERAINVLDHGRRHGLPGPRDETLRCLARHADAIADRLEYFGPSNTSNHLANNGRGLYRLGLELDIPWAAAMGREILLHEAAALFRPSGVMREASSHYHLLYTQRYLDVWLCGEQHGCEAAPAFRDIAARALAVLPRLDLAGGFPLIGDISPDCPPAFLQGLADGSTEGWVDGLEPAAASAVAKLRREMPSVSADRLAADGWVAGSWADWSGIWHVEPDGWVPMPGHGHNDCGGFELHFGKDRVFVDPGRGAYGEQGEAAAYRAGPAHNILVVDGHDPYPPNKPYYDDAFRLAVCGPRPGVERRADGLSVVHSGYTRLAGVGAATRAWRFSDNDMVIDDLVEGDGDAQITRYFHTPLTVTTEGGDILLSGAGRQYRMTFTAARPRISEIKIWRRYGVASPGTSIALEMTCRLPWRGEMSLAVS